MNLVFNSISFENWILLHFEYTTKAFKKSADIKSYLKHKHAYDYEKNNHQMFDDLKDNFKSAMKRAKKQRIAQKKSADSKTKPWNLNPFTNMDLLFKEIQKYVVG